MDNSNYHKYNVKLFSDQISGLRANVLADRKILLMYLSSYYYNHIVHGYKNQYILDEFIRINNGINVQSKYISYMSKLIRKYKKTKELKIYDDCYNVIGYLIEFQSNRDLYFKKLCKIYNMSLTSVNYIFPDDTINLDKEYIEKIDNILKKVM